MLQLKVGHFPSEKSWEQVVKVLVDWIRALCQRDLAGVQVHKSSRASWHELVSVHLVFGKLTITLIMMSYLTMHNPTFAQPSVKIFLLIELVSFCLIL